MDVTGPIKLKEEGEEEEEEEREGGEGKKSNNVCKDYVGR